MKKINKIFTFILLYLSISNFVYAQVSVSPLRYGANNSYQTFNNARVAAVTDTIFSFFLDDFTKNGMALNSKLWKSSGVTVNNTKAINPPTQNVVTFDGIDQYGTPYNFTNSFSYGACDNLESNIIKLKPTTDSIFVQFYWQAGGFVERPDSVQTDSISLFLKSTKFGIWKKYWTYTEQKKSIDPTKFYFEKIYIPDSLVKECFQLKFQSFGNQSGAWDNWHIDYVKVDKYSPTTINQFYSANTNEVSILKQYTAITKTQFDGFEDKEVKDSISFRVNNFTFKNNIISTKSVATSNNTDKSPFIVSDLSVKPMPDTFNIVYKINKSDFINANDSSTISVSNFITNANELSDNSLSNDTAKISSTITNYLAYDDGSAEGAFGINQAAGRVLYKIKLNRPDTITAVDFSWVKAAYNVSSSSFKLLIMKTLDSVRYSKQVLLNYRDTLNLFTRYKLDSAIILSDSFYIGYEQNSANILTLGFDKNTSSNSNILYAIDYKYGTNQYSYRPFTKSKGSLMLRPVFEKGAKLGNKRLASRNINNIEIYPNPSNGIIYIKNDTISSVKICNLLGKEISGHLYNLTVIDQKQAIETNNIDTGFYILYLYNKQNYLTTRKVFIQP